MNEIIDPDIYDLIIGFLSGNNSPEENKRIDHWKKQSGENLLVFQRIQKAWQISVQASVAEKINISQSLGNIHQRLGISNEPSIGDGHQSFPWIKVAASLLVLISISVALYSLIQMKQTPGPSQAWCRVIVPNGSKTITELPDGTKVWVNAGSTLTYETSSFNKKNREVMLDGEAYFKVATNPAKPFIVKAKKIDVKAFGTEFNVKAYADENIVETTLVHGIVKIEGNNEKKGHFVIDMRPKQKITCYTGEEIHETHLEPTKALPSTQPKKEKSNGLPIQPQVMNDVKTVLYTSWKDNRWIIEGERIGDLAVILERKFDVVIKFDSEKLKDYRFTGTFQNETLEQVFQVLKLTAPIVYKIGKGEVVIGINQGIKTRYEKYIN
jgi:transmembrane sensor